MSTTPTFNFYRVLPRDAAYLNRRSGNKGEIFYDFDNQTLRIFDGDRQGGFSFVTERNIRQELVTAELAKVVFDFTVVGPQDGDTGNKYQVDGVYWPALTMVVGYTYIFDQSDLTNVYFPNANGTTVNPHPINFSSDNANGTLGGGTAYVDNVSYRLDGEEVSRARYNGVEFNTSTTRQVWITVTNDTPSTLYYWCYNHLNMGSTIAVSNPGTGTGTGSVSISVSETTPVDPNNGNLWLNTNNGRLYVYIEDGTSNQWVQPAVPQPILDGFATVEFVEDQIQAVRDEGITVAADDSTKIRVPLDNGIQIVGAGGIVTSSDANGVITITGSGTIGDLEITGTTITTDDSSSITFAPAVIFNSDLTVENELAVTNLITTESVVTTSLFVDDIVLQGSLSTQGSVTPEIVSDNEIFITPGTTTVLNGLTTFYQSTEVINTKTGATGTVIHDFSTGAVWYHDSLAANFTANFTNVPLTNNRSIVVTLILNQGATARIPSAVQIEGVGQTINWFGGSPPSGNVNAKDVVSFSLIRVGSVWAVLGSLTTYS
jgi:hypothetical protein